MVKFEPMPGTLELICDVNCSANEFVHCWIFVVSELAPWKQDSMVVKSGKVRALAANGINDASSVPAAMVFLI